MDFHLVFLCFFLSVGRTIALQPNLQDGSINLSPTEEDVESTFRECCNLGLALADEKEPCDNVRPTIHTVPITLRSVCLSVQLQCCTQKKRIDACQKGEVIAKQGVRCPDQKNTEEQYCCEACKVGLIVGAIGSSCVLPPLRVGTLWNSVFQDCCIEIANATGSSQQIPTERVEEDQNEAESRDPCSLWPGELCEETCVPVPPASYKCLCRPGWQLMSDGRSCGKTSSTISCHTENPCSHICQDTADGILCSCPLGYELETDGTNCRRAVLTCPVGYTVDSTSDTCIDIDECLLKRHECVEGVEVCVNNLGSYSCETDNPRPTCEVGYEYSGEEYKCVDTDECLRADACDQRTERCINTPGSFICQTLQPRCQLGFEFSPGTNKCIDVDECRLGIDNCDRGTERCSNTYGGFNCETISLTCDPGYELTVDRRECVDVNECLLQTHNCLSGQHCVNTIGSFSCQLTDCEDGYGLNTDTGRCEDINECLEGQYECDSYQRCVNLAGSYKCECRPGFQIDNLTHACIDINECQLQKHNCLSSQRCDNTVGSYSCTRFLNCGTGYTLNIENGLCEDDDECTLGTDTCKLMGPDWMCHNTHGSYRCVVNDSAHKLIGPEKPPVTATVLSCPVGYQVVDNTCRDIDECTLHPTSCPLDYQCVNTDGSYKCIKETRLIRGCPPGLRYNAQLARCEDINECEEIINLCSHECYNYHGRYQCLCPSGFRLLEDNRTCGDINECETNDYNPCMGFCQNELGTYSCSCPSGYTLARNNVSCIDIDECSLAPNCGKDQICVNIGGNYRCADIVCQPGYVRHDHDCTLEDRRCLVTDRECLKRPIAFRYHFLSIPSDQDFPRNQQLYTFRTQSQSPGTFQFKLDVHAEAPPDIEQATRKDFQLVRSSYNVAKIYLLSRLKGPQDIRLTLTTTLRFEDAATTRISFINIYVSQFTY